jgi:tetratricopeptide (TPR) repeat protein
MCMHSFNINRVLAFFAAITLVFTACKEAETDNNNNSTPTGIKAMQEMVARFPDSLPLRLLLVDGLVNEKSYPEALRQADSIIKRLPGNPDHHSMKGEILLAMKDTSTAIREMETALRPGEMPELLLLLYASKGDKRLPAICDSLIKANGKKDARPEPYYYKGIYYATLRDTATALKTFDQCLGVQHSFMDAYIEKGAILYEQKKYAEALKVFELSNSVANTFADGYYWQGKTHEALNHKSEALLNYQKALALDKNIAEAAAGVKRLQ